MPFFDFLNDDNNGSLLPEPGGGSLPVTTSGQGSIIPSYEDPKRGKKTKIAVHRIKPLTPTDKAKLETLSKMVGGNPSFQDLMDWGIRYEIDPSETIPKEGAQFVRPAMGSEVTGEKKQDTRIIQGDPGDIFRATIGRMPGFHPEIFDEEMRKAQADREQKAKDLQTQMEVKKAQAAAPVEESPDQDVIDKEKKQIDENARLLERQRAITGDDGTPGKDSIFEVFGALSNDPMKAFTLRAQKALQIIGKNVPMEPMSKIAFWAALPAYAEALGQDAYQKVISPIAKIDKELRDRYKAMEGKGQEDVTASEAKIRDLEERQKTLANLANDSALNTPLGVISFILMSLVLGPNMAAFILTRSSARGKARVELAQVNTQLKREEETRQRALKMQDWASRQQLESHEKLGLAQAETQAHQGMMRESKSLDYYYRMKEMEAEYKARQKLQGGKEDPKAKALLASFKHQQAIVGTAEKEVDRLREEVKNWSSQAASAIDGNMRNDFKRRWADAEKRLRDAETRQAAAEDALFKLGEIWNRNYGNAPAEVESSTGGGGE